MAHFHAVNNNHFISVLDYNDIEICQYYPRYIVGKSNSYKKLLARFNDREGIISMGNHKIFYDIKIKGQFITSAPVFIDLIATHYNGLCHCNGKFDKFANTYRLIDLDGRIIHFGVPRVGLVFKYFFWKRK